MYEEAGTTDYAEPLSLPKGAKKVTKWFLNINLLLSSASKGAGEGKKDPRAQRQLKTTEQEMVTNRDKM